MRWLASGGFHRFDYDERGRITEASTDRCEVKLAFDHAGRRTKDERGGRGVRHRHAADHRHTLVLGRFELVQDARQSGMIAISGPADARTILHEVEPGVLLRESSNGTSELLQFDEDERLEARLAWKRTSDGAWTTWSVRYSYTPEGDLIRIEDSARGMTQYEVDAAHRLIAEITPYGQRLTYALDAAGNVLAKPGLRRVEIGTGNRLSACEDERFEYDHRDHLSRRFGRDGSTTTYTYDSFDMLVRIERKSVVDAAPAVFEYEYDGLGRRTVARTPRYQRTFYWDGDRLAAEILPDGRLRIYSYPTRSALVPIAFTEYADADAAPESGIAYFVYSDPVGMPLHIEDASGRIVWWATRMAPYGLIEIHPTSELEYNLRWPGHYFDPETGLHCNRYRFYDPRLGRYLQSDPMGYAGSEFNLYAYPANPLIHVDVLGLAHPGKTNSGEDSNSDNGGREGTPRTDMDDEPPPRKLPLTTEEAEVLCREQTEREYDIAKSELSPTKAGPVICGVVDRQTGKFFFGLNDPKGLVPARLHDILQNAIKNVDPEKGHYSQKAPTPRCTRLTPRFSTVILRVRRSKRRTFRISRCCRSGSRANRPTGA